MAPIWSTLDEQLRGKLSDLGISPEVKPKEPDLQDVLKENLTKLPTPVRELVEKITTPPPASEREVAGRLKQQVTALKDLSHKKHNLQGKIDATKRAYQELLDEMKAIQTKIEQEQTALNKTSASYMALVNSEVTATPLQSDATMSDPVPEAVAGFITNLGVNLTPEQQSQLQVMLKRPQTEITDEAKRRKTDTENAEQCG